MFLASTDASLATITERLVWATLLLAIATVGLALFQAWSVRLQRRELAIVAMQLELDRQQIEVTREQLRPRLELRAPRLGQPGEFPTAYVEYVSGSEVVLDPCVWLRTWDERRFAKIPSTPSLSRPSQDVTLDELSAELAEKWSECFSAPDNDPTLTAEEWWAAVTWQAADKQRYGWMYVQRVHHVEWHPFTPGAQHERPIQKVSKLIAIWKIICSRQL